MKRLLSLCVVITLFMNSFFIVPVNALEREFYLVVNDDLIPAPRGVPATTREEVVYVPLDLFTQYFGFTYSYDFYTEALTITNGRKTIYINRRLGMSVDDAGRYYNYIYYLSNDVFMVPCQFLSNFFGLFYSFIPNGPLVRVSNRIGMSDQDIYAKYENIFVTQSTVEPMQDYSKSVYLTFDGAPNENTKAILDALSSYNVTATFFITTEGMAEYPDLVFRIIAEGHAIGLGGSRNLSGSLQSPQDCLADIDACNNALYSLAKTKVRLIRFPAEARLSLNTATRTALTDAGYRIWDYNINAGFSNTSVTGMYNNLVGRLSGRTSHAVVRFYCDAETGSLMPSLLSYLQRNQFTQLKVSSLQKPVN